MGFIAYKIEGTNFRGLAELLRRELTDKIDSGPASISVRISFGNAVIRKVEESDSSVEVFFVADRNVFWFMDSLALRKVKRFLFAHGMKEISHAELANSEKPGGTPGGIRPASNGGK